ncbi:MAG: PKD domain-containing protein [Saprospiraceae bacterium]|nr:PKD domain-containing protein [Saprospiraceae bacterium]
MNILPDVVVGCSPQLVRFEPPTTSVLNDAYSFDWDFGDGKGSDQLAPSHIYQTAGTYIVRLKVTSPTGCQLEASLEDAIGIKPSPTADFFL